MKFQPIDPLYREAQEQYFMNRFSVDEIFCKNLVDSPGLIGQRAPNAYPSSASTTIEVEGIGQRVIGGCHRADYYRIKGFEKTNPPNKSAKMSAKVGEALEELFKEQIICEHEFVSAQEPIYIDGLMVSGRLDVVGNHTPTSQNIPPFLYVVEAKSFYGYYATREIMGHWIGRGKDKVFRLPKPKDNQLLQAALYAYVMREYCIGTKLYYMARDSAKTNEFTIVCRPNEDDYSIILKHKKFTEPQVISWFTINGILDRFKVLREAVDTNQLPGREFHLKYPTNMIELFHKAGYISQTDFNTWSKQKNKEAHYLGDWECSYCDYKDLCWKG